MHFEDSARVADGAMENPEMCDASSLVVLSSFVTPFASCLSLLLLLVRGFQFVHTWTDKACFQPSCIVAAQLPGHCFLLRGPLSRKSVIFCF